MMTMTIGLDRVSDGDFINISKENKKDGRMQQKHIIPLAILLEYLELNKDYEKQHHLYISHLVCHFFVCRRR